MRCTLLHLTILLGLHAQAQVNGYASLSGITGTTLQVASANETYASFAVGKQVVVMQMQDNVIGANTGNNASFGDLSAILSAGLYEVRDIVSVSRTGPTLNSVTLDRALGNTYNFGANASVQAITFELLGDGNDYTTTAAITALAWGGTLGGVVAIRVQGTLQLNHSVTADQAGFRGGARDLLTSSATCDGTTYRASSVTAGTEKYATKGEGIYRLTNTDWADARGKILNGGGGGNEHNGGGGGGGNYTAGGLAGPGYQCGGTIAGGLGGIALGPQASAQRVFMGGGGGGGEGNNSVSTAGAIGGGIVLIKADAVITLGTCAGIRISADGGSVALAGNDGAGGGGAGGSIVIEAGAFTVASSCPLTIRANGGTGGSINDAVVHGGGGGGGQGLIVFSTGIPAVNVTVATNNGGGGCNNNSSPCNSFAGSGAGSNGSGVIANGITPLPVELLSFQALPDGDKVAVTWSTGSERDNSFFAVESSVDGAHWQEVARVAGAGTTQTSSFYRAFDRAPHPGLSFYRLQQVDNDGRGTTSTAVAVHFKGPSDRFTVFPNPAGDLATLHYQGAAEGAVLQVLNDIGQVVGPGWSVSGGTMDIDLTGLAPGCYTLLLRAGDQVLHQRLVVRR